ncbi:hypothetical protein PPERSA_04685 [Pseudocohnilembus persalinus]|uniref:Uncharacterized protein n=1 Tax=Pseudocohnilembus persalinus TaxID=266149 RepID=A0A0V0R4H4_PSEPJ|nr:hypothetical protein PPERSA_04685 [Pseudocohnilembus persalinus]|eukprot:KRX09379.1 hypothetical protein PPERSA_04685 [Pseudocohnilembus persalinus]
MSLEQINIYRYSNASFKSKNINFDDFSNSYEGLKDYLNEISLSNSYFTSLIKECEILVDKDEQKSGLKIFRHEWTDKNDPEFRPGVKPVKHDSLSFSCSCCHMILKNIQYNVHKETISYKNFSKQCLEFIKENPDLDVADFINIKKQKQRYSCKYSY